MAATSKRRRWYRFTLRRLFILVTIVCLYFAGWVPTRTQGVEDFPAWYAARNKGYKGEAEVRAPYLLAMPVLNIRYSMAGPQLVTETHRFVWFFGWIKELPFTKTEIEPAVVVDTPPRSSNFEPVLPPSVSPSPRNDP